MTSFSPKAAWGLSGQRCVFQAHPRGSQCQLPAVPFLHFLALSRAQSQPRPAAGGVKELCNHIPSGIRRVCLAPEAH